jgi:hypothetical protein
MGAAWERHGMCELVFRNCGTHHVPAPVKQQTMLSSRCNERQGCNLLGRTTVAKLFKIFLQSTGNYFTGQSVLHPSGPNTWFNVFEDKLQISSKGSIKNHVMLIANTDCKPLVAGAVSHNGHPKRNQVYNYS